MIALVAKHNLTLATGHVATDEALMILREANGQGVRRLKSSVQREPGPADRAPGQLERFRLVHSTAVMVLLPAEVAMAAPYSMDLRERVAKAWDKSGDADEIATTFQVSRAWVHRLIQRRRETGTIAPRKPTKFRSRVLAGQEARLAALITARPDATLAELRETLPTTAALSTLWLEIDRLGLTVKKNGTRRRTASP